MDFKKVLRITTLLFVGIVIGIFSTLNYQKFTGPKQTVTIIGSGEVDATTDQATISIQVTNNNDAEKLKAALIKLGIPESRITQSGFISPIGIMEQSSTDLMIYPKPNPRPSSSVNFTVVLDNLKNIEKVYSTVNDISNTQIVHTYYSLNNRKTWETKAKEMALEDARSQIESVAKINKLKVGKLLSLQSGSNPIPYPMDLKARAMDGTTFEDATNSNMEANNPNTEVTEYREQTVKITASYTAQYELYSPFLSF